MMAGNMVLACARREQSMSLLSLLIRVTQHAYPRKALPYRGLRNTQVWAVDGCSTQRKECYTSCSRYSL